MNHIQLFEDFTTPVSRKRELYDKKKNKTITPEEAEELAVIMQQHYADMEREADERREAEDRYKKEQDDYLTTHNNRIGSDAFHTNRQQLIYTNEFKAWFGDWEKAHKTGDYSQCSQIVDTSGTPLLLYHVTKHEWDEYDASKVSSSTHDMGRGVYFSDTANVDRWVDFVKTDMNHRNDVKRIPVIKKPMYANVRKLKVVKDAFIDYEDSGMDNNESNIYDGKVEGNLQDIMQGIVFDPKNVKFL